MKINIQIPTTPKRTRILAGFMAFLIFALTFQEAFVGWDFGTKVKAVDIKVNTKYSSLLKGVGNYTKHSGYSVSNANQGSESGSTEAQFDYTYTGKVKNARVNLYDYLSDEELTDGYGHITKSNDHGEGGYLDNYEKFNKAVSTTDLSSDPIIISPASENITIKYISDVAISHDMYVIIFQGSNYYSSSSGVKMSANTAKTEFTYTLVYDDFHPSGTIKVKFQEKNGSSAEWTSEEKSLSSWTKDTTYIFRNYGINSNSNKTKVTLWQSTWGNSDFPETIHYWGGDITPTTWPGASGLITNSSDQSASYTFTDHVPASFIFVRGNTTWQTVDINRALVIGHDYYFKKLDTKTDGKFNVESVFYYVFADAPQSGAQAITSDKYETPLYFGAFIHGDLPGSYTTSVEPYITENYNNFFWQANMAQRGDEDHKDEGKAATQKLVDPQLNDDNQLTQNGVVLPYFSKDWADNHKYDTTNHTYSDTGADIMKCYESTDEHIIAFPFYEIKADSGTVRGSGTANTGEKARFYQFNAKDANIFLRTDGTYPYFEETTNKIRSNQTDKIGDDNIRRVGFFPFNNADSENGSKNNLGFGAKLEMNFKLTEDGMVDAVDTPDGQTPRKIDTMFEFLGDDDLWVFVDGNLLLDMGGDHSESSGLIDFAIANRGAYVNKAYTFGDNGELVKGKNDLSLLNIGSKSVTGADFNAVLKEGSFKNSSGQTIANSAATGNNVKYDTQVTHTMTIFYMERGMMDSNMMIRFNYAIESNFTKMKVQEETNFEGINAGLKNLTKKAADNDVFKYTIQNSGTAPSDVLESMALYPTYDTYQRNINVNGVTGADNTTLTQQAGVNDTEAVYLITTDDWESGNARIGAYLYNDSESADSGLTVLAEKVGDKLYRIPVGAAGTYSKIKFYRIGSGCTALFPKTGNLNRVTDLGDGYWNSSSTSISTFTRGAEYTINDWDSAYQSSSNGTYKTYYPTTIYDYTPADNGKHEVAATSYLWVDDFTSQLDVGGKDKDNISGMTGKTASDGSLYLMYGTPTLKDGSGNVTEKGKESSAEFECQFVRGSIMYIAQADALTSPDRSATPAGLNGSNTRTVSEYYSTTVRTFDRGSNNYLITPDANVGDEKNIDTHFEFTNNLTDSSNGHVIMDPSWSDMMTEVFTNTPNVGAITVEKKIASRVDGGDVEENTNDTFAFTITFSDVFGVSGNNPVDSDYTNIAVRKINRDGTVDGTVTALGSGGTFSLKRGEKLTISGIPVGTKYQITETNAGANYEQQGTAMPAAEVVTKGSLNTNNQAVDENGQVVADRNETVVNVRKVGSLTLSKAVTGNASQNTFTFTGTFTAPAGVDLRNYSITGTGATVSGYSNDGSTCSYSVAVPRDGSVVLSGIPYGTRYTVNETLPSGATSHHYGTNSTLPASGTVDSTHLSESVTITNVYPNDIPITVTKTNGTNGLPGAELELYFRETTMPPTYSFNEPEIAPLKQNNKMIPESSAASITVPEPDKVTSQQTVNTYTITYGTDTTPTSVDKDWILPRSDSDYIYFRDYNVGQYEADKDSVSFNNTTGKRSWVQTNFAQNGSGTHNQDQELGFTNRNLWVAAKFSGTNKPTVQYAVWERFVDEFTYTDTNSESQTVNTVVWKIQPPDGYTNVQFLVYNGNNCIRSTEEFNFELGKIYHKTEWGGIYAPDFGGSYYNVPVNDETAVLWAPASGGTNDRRNTAMDQPRNYEPTEQKVIFCCNSLEVWHNIHIEFFEEVSSSSSYDCAEGGKYYKRINGQAFPGYMMEPYAYAENNYRLKSGDTDYYLTYELTIPKDATYFRINNGVDNSSTKGTYSASAADQSPYAFRTKITALNGSASNGTKNYNNYFVLNNSGTSTTTSLSGGVPTAVTLINNRSAITNMSGEETNVSYSTIDVESDYDFIYFEQPSGWSDDIYAYFYGGGDLRGDNWQRACYSAWPGVAAAGAETNSVYATTYAYPTAAQYNGDTKSGTLNPEATFYVNDGNVDKKVYKFRIPKGDRTNYSKVIFNDGLSVTNGSASNCHETGVISYQPGYIYRENGSCIKQYEKSPTNAYAARGGAEDYIYIKMNESTLNTWDDLHITFYDSNGSQILQGGHGYVMQYAGINNSNYYFRIPIPANAAKFKLNNGMNKSADHTRETGFYDILRKAASTDPISSTDYKGLMEIRRRTHRILV